MSTGYGNHVTALIGSLSSLCDGGISNGQLFRTIDMVGDGILVLNLVHVGKDDWTADSVGGQLDLEFMT